MGSTPILTGPMADALKRGREQLNIKFLAARTANGRLEPEAFLDHLATTVAPIVESVAAEFAEKVDAVTAALYDLSLEMFAAALLGPQPKNPAVSEVWRRLLPRVPRLLAREPELLTGCLTNAIYNLAAAPGARPADWIDGMIAAAPHCATVRELLDCGKVLAWRAGMAQYRYGAIATAKGLSAALVTIAVGFPEGTSGISAALDRLAANPWVPPAEAAAGTVEPARIRVMAKAGAFRGFSGQFLRPPRVSCVDRQILVSDGEFTWLLVADVFGIVFDRIGRGPLAPAPLPPDVKLNARGNVRWGEVAAAFDELMGSSSAACDGRTLAATVPSSHHVFLLACY
jgi:hypothetical protein